MTIRQQPPESVEKTISNPSPCHPSVSYRWVPVFVVGADGQEERVGRARFCPWSDWLNGRQEHCGKVLGLICNKKNWPKEVVPHSFSAIMGRVGPGYWRSHGYHLIFKDGCWMNMRQNDYLPPFKSIDEADPYTRHVIKFRGGTGKTIPAMIEQEARRAYEPGADFDVPSHGYARIDAKAHDAYQPEMPEMMDAGEEFCGEGAC